MRRLRKSLRSQNRWKSVTYLTLIVVISRSYVDELKRRVNSEWAALSQAVIEHAGGKWRQRLPFVFMLEEDILSTCCNKADVM